MAYQNGRFPKSKLVYFEGRWFFPGTLRRWKALRAEAREETGETLELTSAYRDYDEQGEARAKYGNGAAVQGTSSHGGIWTGQTTGRGGLPTWVQGLEAGALDVGDYYNIPWATFERLATKHGFITNIVVPQELWHIVDLDPWGHKLLEEDDMTPDERKMLKEIHHRLHKELTGPNIGKAVWATGGMGGKVKRMADRTLAVYNSIRDGKKGVRTNGTLTAVIRSEVGAQKIYRAKHGGEPLNVQELADELAPMLSKGEAEELATAVVQKVGEALTDKG